MSSESIRKQKRDAYLRNADKVLEVLKDLGYDFLDKNTIYQVLLYQLDHIDIPGDLFSDDLSVDEMVLILREYYDVNGFPLEDIIIEVTSESFEINEISFRKSQFKVGNQKWTIHKTDKDFFPSDPHGHCYAEHIKVHLKTGNIYRQKQCLGKMRKQDFESLKRAISDKLGSSFLKKVKTAPSLLRKQ